MDIIGGRKFVEIPGSSTHELPPLLVQAPRGMKRLDKVMDMANGIIESEDLIPDMSLEAVPDTALDLDMERRKMDMALNLVDQYLGLVVHWRWGDSILEWIRQCEITFETRRELRNVLRHDVWPHAGRSSFVTLLADKNIPHRGIELRKAVGLRLTFRQPPPISCFSNQFLFYLNASAAGAAYQKWTEMSPDPISSLPPERFSFQVVNLE